MPKKSLYFVDPEQILRGVIELFVGESGRIYNERRFPTIYVLEGGVVKVSREDGHRCDCDDLPVPVESPLVEHPFYTFDREVADTRLQEVCIAYAERSRIGLDAGKLA